MAHVLDYYETLLDALEDEAVRIADSVFVDRGRRQLEEIYALARPVHAATVATQPLVRGFEELAQDGEHRRLDVALAAPLRSEIAYVLGRLERVDALLSSAQQLYFNLAQDDANRLTEEQGDVTRKMSGYALLVAIPTIVFSLYGTNFNHVPLLSKSWGYGVMLGVTTVLCLVAWWRLSKAGWI